MRSHRIRVSWIKGLGVLPQQVDGRKYECIYTLALLAPCKLIYCSPLRLFFLHVASLSVPIPARIFLNVSLIGAHWRHFSEVHIICSRSFCFQVSHLDDLTYYTVKRVLLPYIQEAGNGEKPMKISLTVET